MATTTSSFAPSLTPFPYLQQPSQAPEIPTRELRASVLAGVITAGGAGNEQAVNVDLTFPQGYAFRLMAANMRIWTAAGAANAWPDSGIAIWRDSDGTEGLQLPVELHSEILFDGAGNTQVRVYRLMETPDQILIPFSSDAQVEFDCRFFNDTQNSAAGSIDFYARFLQYTIEQARFWSTNLAGVM